MNPAEVFAGNDHQRWGGAPWCVLTVGVLGTAAQAQHVGQVRVLDDGSTLIRKLSMAELAPARSIRATFYPRARVLQIDVLADEQAARDVAPYAREPLTEEAARLEVLPESNEGCQDFTGPSARAGRCRICGKAPIAHEVARVRGLIASVTGSSPWNLSIAWEGEAGAPGSRVVWVSGYGAPLSPVAWQALADAGVPVCPWEERKEPADGDTTEGPESDPLGFDDGPDSQGQNDSGLGGGAP